MLFHVLNRGVGRMQIFRAEKDYDAFHRVVEQTLRVAPMRICAYCWMPNHWHFVLWPERDGDLSKFMQRMANMHTQRWQRAKLRVGYGHLYQGRFKSFPIETDEHFYCVVRYVERNALRAGLVERAEDWKWGSLQQRMQKTRDPLLAEWPLPRTIRLDRARQLAADGSRVGGDSAMRSSRQPLRQCRMDRTNRRSNLACNRRSVVAVALTRRLDKCATQRILPNICACPLYLPCVLASWVERRTNRKAA